MSEQIQSDIGRWVDERERGDNMLSQFQQLFDEVGELDEALRHSEVGILDRIQERDIPQDVLDEMTDIGFALYGLFHLLNVSLDGALQERLEYDHSKYNIDHYRALRSKGLTSDEAMGVLKDRWNHKNGVTKSNPEPHSFDMLSSDTSRQ